MYYTGVKCTSYAGFGLTEGQFLGIISFFTTAILGQDYWTPTFRMIAVIPVAFIELFMALFALVDTIKYQCPISRLARFHELVPLAQFIGLSYAMTYTQFYALYPALALYGLSLIFYLQNGKLVVASVTETKIALFHLELVYIIIPVIPYLLQKTEILDKEWGEKAQIWGGYIFAALVTERAVAYTLILVSQITKYLGYGFFDVPPKSDEKLNGTISKKHK